MNKTRWTFQSSKPQGELKVKLRGAIVRIPLWGDAFQTWKAGTDHRGIRRTLLKLYRSGTPLDEIFEAAAHNLDERNREILVDSLARERKRKKGFPNINGLILALNDAGVLTGSATADATLISDCLHKLGTEYVLSEEAYRKRVARLQLALSNNSDRKEVQILSVAQSTPAGSNAANGSGKIAKNNRGKIAKSNSRAG